MKVEFDVRPLPGFPRLEGPHALSWSYLLDYVFADAYTRRLATLRVVLPSPQLEEEVALRCEGSGARTGLRGEGLAVLDGRSSVSHSEYPYERLYGLEFGVLAPSALRPRAALKPLMPKPSVRPSRHAERSLSVYTLQARLLGLPLRAALALNRPDLYDRTTFRLRRAFAREGRTPAYYHLSAWHLSAHTSAPGAARDG